MDQRCTCNKCLRARYNYNNTVQWIDPNLRIKVALFYVSVADFSSLLFSFASQAKTNDCQATSCGFCTGTCNIRGTRLSTDSHHESALGQIQLRVRLRIELCLFFALNVSHSSLVACRSLTPNKQCCLLSMCCCILPV